MNATPAIATIVVNDRPHPLPADATLGSLLGALGLMERKGVAVAVNGSVVSRGVWSARRLAEDDRILVIQATQGG